MNSSNTHALLSLPRRVRTADSKVVSCFFVVCFACVGGYVLSAAFAQVRISIGRGLCPRTNAYTLPVVHAETLFFFHLISPAFSKRAEASANSAKELNRLVSVSSETKPLADLPDEFFQAFR